MDTICSQNGLVATVGFANDGPTLSFETGTLPFVYQHGAFRIVFDRLSHEMKRQLNLSRLKGSVAALGRSGDESFAVHFTICAEPRVEMIEAEFAQITEARDDRKNTLILPGRRR